MNDLAITQNKRLTALDIQAQVNLLKEVMDQVMVKDTHYGVIPGCKSPSLYKAGAEKILATFRLAAEPVVTDLSTDDEARYRVEVRLLSPSGVFVGSGVGECSSNEDKYKWRAAVCEEEFNETPENRRREKWKKGYYDSFKKTKMEPSKTKQVRTDHADIANTVLKMAKKRGQIDATLTATAASDIFTQDVEDLPDGYVSVVGADNDNSKKTEPKAQPKEKATEGEPANPVQIKLVQKAMANAGKTEEEFVEKFGMASSQITKDILNSVMEWAK